jgi:hypothetical protein
VIMRRPITTVSDIDSSIGDIGEPLNELEIWLINIESRISDETIDLTLTTHFSHELDEKKWHWLRGHDFQIRSISNNLNKVTNCVHNQTDALQNLVDWLIVKDARFDGIDRHILELGPYMSRFAYCIGNATGTDLTSIHETSENRE